MIDAAIQSIIDREDAQRLRRELQARLEIERTTLTLGISAPWLDEPERRRIAEKAVRTAWDVLPEWP